MGIVVGVEVEGTNVGNDEGKGTEGEYVGK